MNPARTMPSSEAAPRRGPSRVHIILIADEPG